GYLYNPIMRLPDIFRKAGVLSNTNKFTMDNTTYEFFIRRCWDCDRFSHGANTDTWEDLLIKHHNLKNASVGTFKEAEKEFTKKLAQVKAYLDKAFNKLITTAKKKKINPDVA